MRVKCNKQLMMFIVRSEDYIIVEALLIYMASFIQIILILYIKLVAGWAPSVVKTLTIILLDPRMRKLKMHGIIHITQFLYVITLLSELKIPNLTLIQV